MSNDDFEPLDPYEDEDENPYPLPSPYEEEAALVANKHLVLSTVTDLVADFLFLDRKGDIDVPEGTIQEMILNGQLSVEDLVIRFREDLQSVLLA